MNECAPTSVLRLPRQIAMAFGLAALVMTSVPSLAVARSAPESFADLAEELSPAVVNISTSHTVETVERSGPPTVPGVPEGSPFNELFRDFFDRRGPQQRGPRTAQSLGSGFVISADGFVVTNNHVIEDADEITVNFPDGSSYDATLVGTDPKTDIAILKIEGEKPFPFVAFGDSDAARVGDWVLAIGNPFGLGGSVSAGIISARNRDIDAGPYDDFIQTDAAINRGNSGGPLFNMDGQVVGVNTAIISPSGGSIGIGFSVPSKIVSRVVDQLQEFGMTRRGWLGVKIKIVGDELAEALGLERPSGAFVEEVVAAGPAEESGIEAGDVILKFDGTDVAEMRDLPRMVADTEVGKSVRVVVFRKGKTQTLKVKLGLLEEGERIAMADTQTDAGPIETVDVAALGLGLSVLTDTLREEFGVDDSINGVVVVSAETDGPSSAKGIAPGNVIVEVGQEPVATPDEVAAGVEKAREAGRKSVLLLVHGDGDLRFVPVAIEG